MAERKFKPHPEIAPCKSKFKPGIHKTWYLYDYIEAEKRIQSGKYREGEGPIWTREIVYRNLILSDLFFIIYFVFGIPDNKNVNDPFVVNRCNEVQCGPEDSTLDVWARSHFKSSIITIAETIQYTLKYPERATGIFSHKASVAKGNFLFEIKQEFENNPIYHACFPEVAWVNPQKEAPLWSLDGGLVFKRTTNRKEANISAHGLIEGMPVGLHFERRIYDDIVTEDIGESKDQMEKVKQKFDSSQNLRTHTDLDTHRVVGTYYHYNDPLTYIRDKLIAGTDNKKYLLRLYPATEDGQPNGKPVFLSEKNLNDLRGDRTFFCQQLLDPSPGDYSPLDPLLLQDIEPERIPKDCFKFMVIDQAGDLDTNIESGDCWAVGLFSVYPFADDTGASSIYIRELIAEPLGETEAVDMISKMYVHAGTVKQIGVEKVGMSGTHNAIRKVLKESYGRTLTIETDGKKKKYNAIVILRPSGRHKNKFIDSSLSWPLSNAKIFISSEVQEKYKDKLILEMEQFPFGKTDDILNILAYLYDMIMNYDFPDKDIGKGGYCNTKHYRTGALGWTGG